jgi:hypothetical protein
MKTFNGVATTDRVVTVSHTLDAQTADRLRRFAFHQRLSESSVIEYALQSFLAKGDDAMLGARLRKNGASLRRKV